MSMATATKSARRAPSCTCSASVSRTDYICFNGKCVDSIGDCDAWCKAADADREAGF
jgi:hypothetical protein